MEDSAESPTDTVTFVDSLWMRIVVLSEVKTTYLGVFDLQCGRRGLGQGDTVWIFFQHPHILVGTAYAMAGD